MGCNVIAWAASNPSTLISMLQPRAFRSLNAVVPLVSVSNYYIMPPTLMSVV